MTAIGALGPWVSFFGFSAHGIRGDGWFIALPALAAGALVLLGKTPAQRSTVPLALAALALVVAGWKLADFAGLDGPFGVSAFDLMSWGLPLAAIGSLALLGSLLAARTAPGP